MPGKVVMKKTHRWMEMSYVPVEVMGEELNGDGEPATFPVGEKLVGVSCFDCHIPLTGENKDGECTGEVVAR